MKQKIKDLLKKEYRKRGLFYTMARTILGGWHYPSVRLHALIQMISNDTDFTRSSTLALVANEIYKNRISGSIAELGVYQGDFAVLMNRVFPDRKLYLFDTFEGFDSKDLDLDHNYSKSKTNDFVDTTVDEVLSKMDYKQNVIVKKGYFPDSIGDLEDRFCFVSLDADLYKPTYEGLKYFYPRLVEGGAIFIHDYNSSRYRGVEEALKEYSKIQKFKYVPLSDSCGSIIILK